MKVVKKNYEVLNETVWTGILENGLKITLIQKPGYTQKFAAFGTPFGSNQTTFMKADGALVRVPDGIAHFLEHKLFDQPEGSVMDRFAALGASPNAYTGFNQTVYHFTCTERFSEAFRVLMTFVRNPWITAGSVEKEKGIIEQELRMYETDPDRRLYSSLLSAMYAQHPVRVDIGGTVASIQPINEFNLLECYRAYYDLSVMTLLVVGDLEPDEVFPLAEEILGKEKSQGVCIPVYPEEPEQVAASEYSASMPVAGTQFLLGVKDIRAHRGADIQEVSLRVIQDVLFGRSSPFFAELYREGLLNMQFGAEVMIERDYGFSLMGGESAEPGKIRERMLTIIEQTKRNGLPQVQTQRTIKSLKGRFYRRFNNISSLGSSFLSMQFRGMDLFRYAEIYDTMSLDDLQTALDAHFRADRMSLVSITPSGQ